MSISGNASLSDLRYQWHAGAHALRKAQSAAACLASADDGNSVVTLEPKVDEVNSALSVTLSCAAIAVLTSGCIKPVAKTNLSSTASLVSAASLDVGYGESSSPGGLAQKATPQPIATGLVPARPGPSSEKVRYLGSAPHICSPSGFGRKSTCFSRS